MNLTCQIATGLDALPAAREIRREVFMLEQGFTHEFDDTDAVALHLLFCDGDTPAATGRVYPDISRPGLWHIGRVAVRKPFRGKGIGAQVIARLEEEIRHLGGMSVELDAQLQAEGFYQRLGYVRAGEEHLDEHCPHVTMRKKLE